jgi:hypothetical protein
MTRIVKVSKVELGAAAAEGSHEDLTNVKRIWRNPVPQRHPPSTVMNTTVPLAWNRPHKYVIGFIDVVGDCYHAVNHNGTTPVNYNDETGDNPDLPYLKAYLIDELGKEWTRTFTGAIIDGVDEGINDGEELVTRIYFSAKSSSPLTPPS